MALCVPHFTATSPVHGMGLYTPSPIAAGAVLWRFDPALDRRVPLQGLRGRHRLSLLHYGYINPHRPDCVVVCGDLSRFWNFPHPGEAANAAPSDQLVHQEALIVATRAIAAGEELLIHPSSDAEYFRKMGLGSGPSLRFRSVTKPEDLDALPQPPYGDIA
jgi:uncharacterized protein